MKHAPAPRSGVDEYLATFAPPVRRTLERVRAAIRRALPDAEETISYRIPAYKAHGRVVVYFAGWSDHYSLYPSTARLEKALRKELAPYDRSGRGTIRFPLAGAVPTKVIAAVAKFRLQEVDERQQALKAKRAAAKKR